MEISEDIATEVSLEQLDYGLVAARFAVAEAEVAYSKNPLSRMLHRGQYEAAQAEYAEVFKARLGIELDPLRESAKKPRMKLNKSIQDLTIDIVTQETEYRLELVERFEALHTGIGKAALGLLGLGRTKQRTIQEAPHLALFNVEYAKGYEDHASRILLAGEFIETKTEPTGDSLKSKLGRFALSRYVGFAYAPSS